MRLQPTVSLVLPILATIVALSLLSCGRDRPVEQASAPARGATPAPQPEPPAAQTAPPAEAPPVSHPAARPPHKAAPRLEPTPTPEPVAKTIAAGTDLDVELLDGASSKTSRVGSVVRARVTRAVVVDGLTVVSEGAIVDGTVTEAVPLRKIGGAASLGLRFDTLELARGARTAISAGFTSRGRARTAGTRGPSPARPRAERFSAGC